MCGRVIQAKGPINYALVDGLQSVEDLFAAAGVNLSGWQLTTAKAVSPDGTVIVGDDNGMAICEGFASRSEAQAWIDFLGLHLVGCRP
jgi:hypothetical protein